LKLGQNFTDGLIPVFYFQDASIASTSVAVEERTPPVSGSTSSADKGETQSKDDQAQVSSSIFLKFSPIYLVI
jgi:hypothetical protein